VNARYIFFVLMLFSRARLSSQPFSLIHAHIQHSIMNMDIDTPASQPINKNKGKGKMIMGELDTLPW
jgi:hypothetical protein